jgi:hypothetical protein
MNIPSFTAEASLSEAKDRYALSFGRREEGGVVLPQNVCWYCNDWGCFPTPCKIPPHV